MSRPRRSVTYTFEGGAASPQFARRADQQLWSSTAKRLLNVAITNAGGLKRRPGLQRITTSASAVRYFPFTYRDGTKVMLAFRDAALDVFSTARSIIQTITGCPWLAADLAAMQISPDQDRVFVTSRAFAPQAITLTAGTWARAALAFDTLKDGSLGQPYYRFAAPGITLTPSATTGAITLTASSSVFVAGHVGTRVRLLGQECTITGFTSGTVVNANVVSFLYPTIDITVGSTSGFAVGDQCTTRADSITCEVSQIVSATVVRVLLTAGVTSPTTTSNTLVGPSASSAISAVASATPAATTQWDEQMISAVRGYPGASVVHRERLFLADYPLAPHILNASVSGALTDFSLGDALDDDGIQAGIGDAIGRRIRHLVSAEQLLILTEVGAYYVGEGPQTPVTPNTIDFLRIGPEAATACNPILAAEGLIYPEDQGDRVIVLNPTGNVRRVWDTNEIGDLAHHIINAPTRMLLVNGSNIGGERYVFTLNADGTLAVMLFRRAAEVFGWAEWTTDGTFIDVALFNKEIWACCLRGGVYTHEVFDPDRLLDNSVVFTNASGATPTDASFGARQIALVWRDGANRVEMGATYTATAGVLTGAPTDGPRTYEGGTRFPVDVTLWPPLDPIEGPSTYLRVAEMSADVFASGRFYMRDRPVERTRAVDDLETVPPLRTGWRRQKQLGRDRDIEPTLTQTEAEPLEVRSIVVRCR